MLYLYKGINVNFFLSKLLELLCSKVKQNLFGKYVFCLTLADGFVGPKVLTLS